MCNMNEMEVIGGSMLLRLMTHTIGVRPFRDGPRQRGGGRFRLGLTYSGQTLGNAATKLRCLRVKNQLPCTESVMVMLGTNDILRNTSLGAMKHKIRNIVQLLAIKSRKVIVFTLPPVPRRNKLSNPDDWGRLNKYNHFIRTGLREEVSCSVIDLFPLFMEGDKIREELFEKKMGRDRPDGIHWNSNGMKVVIEHLRKLQVLI